jgi:hypothetical protein
MADARGAVVMARSRFNDPIEPMTLGNMRDNGVRSLAILPHLTESAASRSALG